MSLPVNNKKGDSLGGKNQKNKSKDSKFIKAGSKPAAATNKVRSTGSRGS